MWADFLQFMFQLLIAGFILRVLQVRLAGTDFGKAVAFIY